LLQSGEAHSAGALPALNVDPHAISVSGLSSGAFMAAQFQVAFSATVMGAGILAGGPYDCAEDDGVRAVSTCICYLQPCSALDAAAVARLTQTTDALAASGLIDPTSNLARQRVWVYRGEADSLVPAATADQLIGYYSHFIPPDNVHSQTWPDAEHAMPTDGFGNACSYRGDPYINDCHFDAAHALLEWIYGPLQPKNAAPTGRTIEFDQSKFLTPLLENGMAETGWLYVPDACANGRLCRLHVAFHGCLQYQDYTYDGQRFGTTFVDHAGYKETADANDIIVLFPQATRYTYVAMPDLPNPEGCWDWWGYTNSSYADKDGPQMAAVKRMVDRVAKLH
jgi:poly(3-hydroxybutyrate) depolymerase